MKKRILTLVVLSLFMFGCKDKDDNKESVKEPNTSENKGQMVKSMPIKLDYFKTCQGVAGIGGDEKENAYECDVDGVKSTLRTSKDSKYIFSLTLEAKPDKKTILISHLNEILGSNGLVQIDDVDIEGLKEDSFTKIQDLSYKKVVDDNKIIVEVKNLG